MSLLNIDEKLLSAAIHSTKGGLQMTGIDPPPVGATRSFNAPRTYSILVGMVGRNTGTVTLNFGEKGLCLVAGRFLGESFTTVDDEVFDAIMEIGNIVAGCVKDYLIGTEYAIDNISLPSVVLGGNYSFYYSRGITVVSVEFELEDIPVAQNQDRFFSTTISFLRTSGC